jgi:hypothetical protein
MLAKIAPSRALPRQAARQIMAFASYRSPARSRLLRRQPSVDTRGTREGMPQPTRRAKVQDWLIWPMQCGVARREATECHICNVAYNIFVLIEFDIVAALQNQQLLRKTRALLVRCGEGSVSCGCRAVRRAGRYRVSVGTNRQGLRYPRTAAARPKGSDANCQPEGEHCSHGCDHPLAGPCYPILNLHPASLELLPVIAVLIPNARH